MHSDDDHNIVVAELVKINCETVLRTMGSRLGQLEGQGLPSKACTSQTSSKVGDNINEVRVHFESSLGQILTLGHTLNRATPKVNKGTMNIQDGNFNWALLTIRLPLLHDTNIVQ